MKRADVVVIGGGIIGLSVAYHLTQYGCRSVVVLEKEGIARGASGVAPGGVRQQWGTTINLAMARQSVGFYRTINDRLSPEYPLRFRECGYIFLAHSSAALQKLTQVAELQRQHGVPTRILKPGEIAELVPALVVEEIVGASYCPTDGYFDDPHGVSMAFAEAAKRSGAVLHYTTATGLETANGRIRGVRTTEGMIAAEHVVLAAGCDSPELAQTASVHLPIRVEPRYLFFSGRLNEQFLDPLVISPEREFAAKQMYNGTLFMSWLGAGRGDDPGQPPRETEWLARAGEIGTRLLPRLADIQIVRTVRGFYDVTPDHQAILGPVDEVAGLHLATGFSGHGFMMAPAVGDNVARGILGMEPTLPLDILNFRRFAAGQLVPEPAII